AATLNNSDGLLRADNLSVTAAVLDNTLGEISGNQIDITATQLTNTGGWIAGDQLQLSAGRLDNTGHPDALAYISGRQISIDTQTLNNQSVIQAEHIHLSGD